MPDANGAAGDAGKTGLGAPGAGSKDLENGKKAEDGDELVPASRLKAALENQERKHESQLGNLRAEFEAFKAGVSKQAPQDKQEAPKRFTRAELSAAVKADQITQEQADDIFAKQVTEDAKSGAVRAALEAVNGATQQKDIDNDLAQYRRLEPGLRDKGSELFERAKAEFDYLRSRGQPDNLVTELAAIRAVLGPLDKLEKAKSAARAAEHHEESGGGGEGGRKDQKKVLETLSAREKSYYQKLIDNGHHKDWAEVETLLKNHARPEVRRRAGARV